MSRRVSFRPEAEAEALETRDWYEGRRPGLGAEFREVLDQTIEQIADSPMRFRRVRGETRRAILNRFPYAVYFRLDGNDIVAVGLLRGVKRTNGRLELLFRAGDQQVGYFDAWLRYDGVGIAKADAEPLKSAVGRPEIELLYDEFDRHERDWVHHLLFWLPGRQYHEVSVRFAVIDLQVFSAAGRFDGGAI